MALETEFLSENDDLDSIVAQINDAHWDADNEIETYDAAALRAYLQKQDTLFVVCFMIENDSAQLAGIASARILHKPYKPLPWLYIDEVDTTSNLRQRGVATALMNALLKLADERDLDEVWLGTETDNVSANKLYQSLDPDAVDQVVGYTFDLD